ncbi:MAG: hypothetical protein D6679_09015 [Candidatus Hydrogenedentota bacterium]|nr:MAG: hypothetical protein D6679_09015 [Candidatus Hydrogenedentota bacterium]
MIRLPKRDGGIRKALKKPPRYALLGLPGPLNGVLNAVLSAGKPPSLVIFARDADRFSVPCPSIVVGEAKEKEDVVRRRLIQERIETFFVAGWEWKIPESWYSVPLLGGWNVHPSLLPRYRGHNPYFWVLARGEQETGVTIHHLTEEFDAGPILLRKRIPIEKEETIGRLWNRLALLGGEAVLEALEKIACGKIEETPQERGDFPRAPRVGIEETKFSKRWTREETKNRVRAGNPFYGMLARLGGLRMKIFGVKEGGEGPEVPCRDGKLVVELAELEGWGFLSGARLRDAADSGVVSEID